MKNLLIPSSILVLVGWGYAIFLYSQLNLPPTESYGDSDWKSQFISTMRSSEQCHLIARRTGVSCSSVQETLDYITQDIHQIHTNGIQYSTALALQRFHPPSPHHHQINHTSLVFPQDYSPIYGQPSKDSKFVLIYLSSKPMSLDLYRQFIHTLRSTGYHGDIIIGLTPSEYSQPQYKTYFSNENIIIYPYLINCTLTTAVVENSQLCFLYDSSRSTDLIPRTISQINTLLFEFFLGLYSDETSAFLISEVTNLVFQSNPFQIQSSPSILFQISKQLREDHLRTSPDKYQYITNCIAADIMNSILYRPLLSDEIFYGNVKSLKFILQTLRTALFSELSCWSPALESQKLLLTYLAYNEAFPLTTYHDLVNPLITSHPTLRTKNTKIVPACLYDYLYGLRLPFSSSSLPSDGNPTSSTSNWTINLTPPSRRGKKIGRPKFPKRGPGRTGAGISRR